jgi:hypothetical protein
MFRRSAVVQNPAVAKRMNKFFKSLTDTQRASPEEMAKRYSTSLWTSYGYGGLIDEKKLSRSRFYVSLSTRGNRTELEYITKRAALVSDTLMLSHGWAGGYNELGVRHVTSTYDVPRSPAPMIGGDRATVAARRFEHMADQREMDRLHNTTEMYGINCPSLSALGHWILDSEPLLKAGLVWYLPSYVRSTHTVVDGVRQEPVEQPAHDSSIDYLIADGRAVDASGANPTKSSVVRPVLRADLPFIEGVSLRQFSRITVEEFAAYADFRDFLRLSFLELDEALNDVQSDRELTKLGLRIRDHVRSARSEMEKARRTRAVSVTGAAIGTVGAILVAVYGPAMEAAIATVGASGGVWGVIHAAAENNIRSLRQNKWHYVWILARESGGHGM